MMTSSEKLTELMTRLNNLRAHREHWLKQIPMFDSGDHLTYIAKIERNIRKTENQMIDLRSKINAERFSNERP